MAEPSTERSVARWESSGVNLVGYLNHVVGLGESARQFVAALSAGRVPHASAAIDLGEIAPRLPGSRAPWVADAELPYDTTILWCNPDRYGIDIDPAMLGDRRLIGRWAWELPELPETWRVAAGQFAEIWVPSRFVRDAVRMTVEVPVRVIPHGVQALPVPPLDRAAWEIPRRRPLFVFVFDHNSTIERKNPEGVIEAFCRAFPRGRTPTLLIKSINAHNHPHAAARLAAAATGHRSVHVVDAVLPAPQRLQLLAGCDCYVSLHRSEGFGITIAEAMAYGRPVIATDYGGSTDFFDDSVGYPVRWRPAAVDQAVPVYPAGSTWAQPDLDHAAELMRSVLRTPGEAIARGRAAAARIAAHNSPAAIARAVTELLSETAG